MRYRNVSSSLLLLLCLVPEVICRAQQEAVSKRQHDSLDQLYQTGKVKKLEYLELSKKFFDLEMTNGVSHESSEMLKITRLFKQIVWSDDSLRKSRSDYYIIMANNARAANRNGEVLYYCDKADKEREARGIRSLFVVAQKCVFFSENESHAKVIQAYKTKYDYISSMPDLIRKDSIKNINDMTVFGILELVSLAYANLQDTAALQQTINIAERIRNALKSNAGLNKAKMVEGDFFINCMYHHQSRILLMDQRKTRHILNRFWDILGKEKTSNPALSSMLETGLLQMEFEYHLDAKNNDSAAYYLAQMKASPAAAMVHGYMIPEYEAWVLAGKGNFNNAYLGLVATVKSRDTVITQLTEDMDKLLYAYTEAENNREELLIAGQQKKKKNLVIFLVSLFALLVVALIYNLMKRRDRNSRKKILALNYMAELQIAEMEEVKLNERQSEQRRLGMELHDNLASHLAGIKHQMEHFSSGFDDPVLSGQFGKILQQVEAAYESTRKKSHEWVWLSKEDIERSFEERINFLVDRIFPDNKFKKMIEVDANALERVPVEIKIVVLRIIQEALINIVKHASADEIMILIYEEEFHLMVHIVDNGRGFIADKVKSKLGHLGLDSMRERVTQVSGIFKIESCNKGTAIIVSIPIGENK